MEDSLFKDYIDTKLITGERLFIARKDVVGYCHYPQHRGAITKSILKNHECVLKECHYFEKCKNIPYWEGIEQQKASKQRKKETARRIKQEKEDQLKMWINTAQDIANDLGYELKVISVQKIPRKKNYIMFYISRASRNDWYMYLELAKAFGMKIGGRVELRHIVDIDGYYATY